MLPVSIVDSIKEIVIEELSQIGLLKKDGSMALWKPDGTLVDSVDWNDGDSPNSQSWGRSPDGGKVLKTFTTPTPGKANN